MQRPIVISLYDFTGAGVRPWAEAGYDCRCYDIQHGAERLEIVGKGTIRYIHADLYSPATLDDLADTNGVAFLMAFPVCTDMAVSGARHFAAKELANPGFQRTAADHAIACGQLADRLGVPYFVENPVSVLSTLWRKPDHVFHPFEYGGYIPESEAEHPIWPEYIMPRDAYSKRTCYWSGNGFVMPEVDPVECHSYGASQAFKKLGGKSMKTKNIRSASPRGVTRAIFLANHPVISQKLAA